jgi:hypothetical protein
MCVLTVARASFWRVVLYWDHERVSAVMRRSREPPADEEGRRLAQWTVLRALQGFAEQLALTSVRLP